MEELNKAVLDRIQAYNKESATLDEELEMLRKESVSMAEKHSRLSNEISFTDESFDIAAINATT